MNPVPTSHVQVGGQTIHDTFAIPVGHGSLRHRLKPLGKRTLHLSRTDVVVIDEISMVSASLLTAIDEALCYARTQTTLQPCVSPFANASIVASGDLFQLPTVMHGRCDDRIHLSPHWASFAFIELTEVMRSGEAEWVSLLSRLRLGHEHLTDDDKAFLQKLVCANHGADGTHVFHDVQRVRTLGQRKADAVEVRQRCVHCPIRPQARVLASLRDKVNELAAYCTRKLADPPAPARGSRSRRHGSRAVHTRGSQGHTGEIVCAVDFKCQGDVVTRTVIDDEDARKAVDDRARDVPRQVTLVHEHLYTITRNAKSRRARARDHVNGIVGTVDMASCKRDNDGTLLALRFIPVGSRTSADGFFVRKCTSRAVNTNKGYRAVRTGFPIEPAIAGTVHRVQGDTTEHDLHILANKEMYQYGQHYVALSRPRSWTHIHLWALDLPSIRADPDMVREYNRLLARPVNAAAVAAFPDRTATDTSPYHALAERAHLAVGRREQQRAWRHQ